MDKVWWKSKTMLLNIVGGLLVTVSAIFPQAKVINDWIGANAVLVGMIWSGLNIALRALTKGAVTLTE